MEEVPGTRSFLRGGGQGAERWELGLGAERVKGGSSVLGASAFPLSIDGWENSKTSLVMCDNHVKPTLHR